ncbi:unnamed protein product [Closterium sp. Yama58-4]|nr:unnamed protein product [Closterium sp. Yama58-4]
MMAKLIGAFALAGSGYQHMWEVCRTLGVPRPGHGTFYRCLDGENGLWSVIINQAKVNMEGVRARKALRSDPAHILSVDGRWSQVREAKHCTVSFMDPVSRKVAFYKNTHRDVDDDTSVKLERVGFDQGMDELREIGFGVAGIVTDGGSSFKTAVRERGLKHQEDWWHKCGTLVRSFKTDVQDATRKAGEVGAATSCEDLYLITINKLLGWLREHPRPGTTFGRGSGKKALVEAVCAARGLEFKDMDPADAKWLHLELQQVLQTEVGQPTVRASTEVVEEAEPGVTVGHGPRDGSEGPNGDGLNGGVGAVEVQWPDVDEMWGWDAHPEHGIRPSSHASMVLVQAWRGLEHNTASLYDGTVGQDKQENVPASGGAAGIATEGGMDNDAAEHRPRRGGRRAPRRRTRQGDGGGAGSESETTARVKAVTVADRLGVHFYHCMVRNGVCARDGHTRTPQEVPDKVACIVEGATSSMNESFHSLILKYAPKRIRFKGSYDARIAMSALHWNNTMDRVSEVGSEWDRRRLQPLHMMPELDGIEAMGLIVAHWPVWRPACQRPRA